MQKTKTYFIFFLILIISLSCLSCLKHNNKKANEVPDPNPVQLYDIILSATSQNPDVCYCLVNGAIKKTANDIANYAENDLPLGTLLTISTDDILSLASFIEYSPDGGTYRPGVNVFQFSKIIGEAIIRTQVAGDVDHDGQAELIISLDNDKGTFMYLNNTWKKIDDESANVIALCDLDNNGQKDIVMSYTHSNSIYAWMNNEYWQHIDNEAANDIVVADIDNNAQEDLVIAYKNTPAIYAWLNNSTWQKIDEEMADSLEILDLDNNGQNDIAIAYTQGSVWAWMNQNAWQKIAEEKVIRLGSAQINNRKQNALLIHDGNKAWAWIDNSKWERANLQEAKKISGDFDLSSVEIKPQLLPKNEEVVNKTISNISVLATKPNTEVKSKPFQRVMEK